MSRVWLFEIQILIVLPIFEDEKADSQSMGYALYVVSLVSLVKNPSILADFLLRQVGVRISLTVEDCLFLGNASGPKEGLNTSLALNKVS